MCFNYGIECEVDEKEHPGCIKVEVANNRYDLMSVEGLAIALGNYLGTLPIPKFLAKNPDKLQQIHVTNNVILH